MRTCHFSLMLNTYIPYVQMEIPLSADTAFVHSHDSFAVDAEPVTLV